MKRLWLGLFLLAASWLPGTGYYRAVDWRAWGVLVAAGLGLLCLSRLNFRGRPAGPGLWSAEGFDRWTRPSGWVLLLWLPALWVFHWPYRLAPLLMVAAVLLAWRPARPPQRVAGPMMTGPAGDLPANPPNLLASDAAEKPAGAPAALQSWRVALAEGLGLAGLVLGLQALALLVYRTFTSYSHELPAPLPQLLGLCLSWAGIEPGVEAGLENQALMLPTMRQVHALGATWELLVDPGTWCFLVSGLAVVAGWMWRARRPAAAAPAPAPSAPGRKAAKRNRPAPPPRAVFWRAWWEQPQVRLGLAWAGAALLWLPVRVALLAGVMVHRALLTDYDAPLDLMRPFWSTGVLLALGLPLAALQARWLGAALKSRAPAPGRASAHPTGLQEKPDPTRTAVPEPPTAHAPAWRVLVPVWGGAVLLTLGVVWDPAGARQAGRVAVDEYHSKWEPTDRPFDTEWYGHLSGYNYACIYDYCSRFFTMSRLTAPLDEQALAGVDVLVLKVPTAPYTPAEIETVVRFVKRGGGLLLIGEHTDVFGTSYHLNAVARRFGFEYRYDCLFGIDSVFEQYYVPPFAPHPVVRYVRGMDFATSCSLRPFQPWRGRSVITSTGLKNAPADYHVSNFYPQAVDRADMRYGAFVQLWAARQGRGRVLAFTDSTIFSNFCTFEPGKAELMLGMLEWLNHRDRWGNVRPGLLAAGALALGAGLLALRRRGELRGLAVAGSAGWCALAIAGVREVQARAFPPLEPLRPLVRVTIDRTACDGPLSKNGFIEGKSNGFGIFERWILRLGYFLRREQGPAALAGDLVVYLYPTRSVDAAYHAALERYVDEGGRVLVLDSAENTNSTAGALLKPFGLGLAPHPQPDGTVAPVAGLPAIPVQAALQTEGGTAFAHLNGRPVATTLRRGRGTVTVLGLGARFVDVRMGVTGDVEPDAALRQVYDFQFGLLRRLIEGPWPPSGEGGPAPGSPEATPAPAK
jgi:hypothetical protein